MKITKANYAIKGNNKQYAKVNKFSREGASTTFSRWGEPETFVFFNKMHFGKNLAANQKDDKMLLADFKKFIDPVPYMARDYPLNPY